MTEQILAFFERKAYGVCSSLADVMGLRAQHVRLSFIYLSFLTFGSPIFVYLVLVFWKQQKYALRTSRRRRILEY